ncbi:outer membrane protein transport protein [Desulfobotulus sp. H1]|uniref:Outer membrane protein transport protein n=1 Tax=Desulfobotulus pelophilus TaxID=2823377 RepID=A0ABT3N7P1_9BACT|nr:outer membrane protein transport protein [Desulfobotulus pelophilus]MCW7753181.1 outer membrane protein transport protein [Desulfobotulus pelophilus]
MKKLIGMCAGILFLGSSVQAALVQPFGIGARNAALGEAVSAYTTDAFAVYYNPAGLSNIKTPTLSAGMAVYDAEVYYKDFKITDSNGNDITPQDIQNRRWKGDKDPLLNPHMGFAMPINEKFSFGVAAYAPYGFHLDTPKDPAQKPMAMNFCESYYTRVVVTPAVSYKVNDRLSLGFGVSMGRSESGASQATPYDPLIAAAAKKAGNYNLIQIDYNNPYITEIEMDDSINWSWNAGIQYQPTDRLSLGLTYRSRTPGNFSGTWSQNGERIGRVSMDFDHPEAVQAGVRYALTERFAMSFDMVWANWSISDYQTEIMTLDTIPENTSTTIDNIALALAQGNQAQAAVIAGSIKAGLLQSNEKNLRRDWKNQIQYKLGMEYVFNDRFTFLAGYVYDPTPVPADTFDNMWPDNDRHIMTIGTSAKVTQNWTIDFAFQHIRTFDWGYRDDINGTSENLNQTAEYLLRQEGAQMHVKNQGYLWGYNLTANYRF